MFVGGQLEYTIVKGLTIGAEVSYVGTKSKGATNFTKAVGSGNSLDRFPSRSSRPVRSWATFTSSGRSDSAAADGMPSSFHVAASNRVIGTAWKSGSRDQIHNNDGLQAIIRSGPSNPGRLCVTHGTRTMITTGFSAGP